MGGSTLGLAMRERKAIDVLCIFLYRYWNSRCAANDLCHIRTHTYNNNQTKSSYQVLDLARSIYMYLGKSTHRLLPVDSYPWIATRGLPPVNCYPWIATPHGLLPPMDCYPWIATLATRSSNLCWIGLCWTCCFASTDMVRPSSVIHDATSYRNGHN